MILELFKKKRHQRVLIPTIVPHQTIPENTLSNYLADLVNGHSLPREIAHILNRLPSPGQQREAAELFWAQQKSLAWEIVSHDALPRQKLRWFHGRRWFYGMALTSTIFATVFFKFRSTISHPQPTPPPATRRVVQQNSPALSKPVTHHVLVKAMVMPVIARHAPPPKTKAVIPSDPPPLNAPANLSVERFPNNQITLSWDPVGADYVYSIYSGDDAAMRNLRKEQDGITESAYTLHERDRSLKGRWIAVTATNPTGAESSLSGAIKTP